MLCIAQRTAALGMRVRIDHEVDALSKGGGVAACREQAAPAERDEPTARARVIARFASGTNFMRKTRLPSSPSLVHVRP